MDGRTTNVREVLQEMTYINMDLVEEIAEINNGWHRVYFKSGRDIVIKNGTTLLKNYFYSHRVWPRAEVVPINDSTGPG